MRTLLALILFSVQAAAAPYPPVSVQVRAEQVAEHSYYLPGLPGAASLQNEGFMSNAGFVVTKAGVVAFDTLPAFREAHRRNAFNTYILMERESLRK